MTGPALAPAAAAAESTVTADAAAVQAAVRNGDATAGLADGTLYVQPNGTGTFPLLVAQAVVAQAVVGQEAASRLAAAGLMPAQVTDLQT